MRLPGLGPADDAVCAVSLAVRRVAAGVGECERDWPSRLRLPIKRPLPCSRHHRPFLVDGRTPRGDVKTPRIRKAWRASLHRDASRSVAWQKRDAGSSKQPNLSQRPKARWRLAMTRPEPVDEQAISIVCAHRSDPIGFGVSSPNLSRRRQAILLRVIQKPAPIQVARKRMRAMLMGLPAPTVGTPFRRCHLHRPKSFSTGTLRKTGWLGPANL